MTLDQGDQILGKGMTCPPPGLWLIKKPRPDMINAEDNVKYLKFEVGDQVRILKYKSIFVKGYALNWSKEISVIKKVNNTVLCTYVIEDFI